MGPMLSIAISMFSPELFVYQKTQVEDEAEAEGINDNLNYKQHSSAHPPFYVLRGHTPTI